jgi:HK97 gp10 family phage protein
MRVVINVSGVNAVVASGRRVRDEIAEEIASDMRRYVPVLSGDLRGTIRTEIGEVARIWAGDASAGIDYPIYQEYGTTRMAAQPFMRPAVYQYRGVR